MDKFWQKHNEVYGIGERKISYSYYPKYFGDLDNSYFKMLIISTILHLEIFKSFPRVRYCLSE